MASPTGRSRRFGETPGDLGVRYLRTNAMKNRIKQSTVLLKVDAIIRELAEEHGGQLPIPAKAIEQALSAEYPSEVARDIAFHLTDWTTEAAFIVALRLFPERFTPEEIRSGVEAFIVHAPNHTAAAAKLWGFPVTDVFEIGAIDGRADD